MKPSINPKAAMLLILLVLVFLPLGCKADKITSKDRRTDQSPIEPFYLDQIMRTKEDVFSELDLSEKDTERFLTDGYHLLDKKSEICGYVFDNALCFTNSIHQNTWLLYEYDYVLNVDKMESEDIYDLSKDISAMMTENYGESDTHYKQEDTFSSWESAEDILLDDVRDNARIYQEDWFFPVPETIETSEEKTTDSLIRVRMMMIYRDVYEDTTKDEPHLYLIIQYKIVFKKETGIYI